MAGLARSHSRRLRRPLGGIEESQDTKEFLGRRLLPASRSPDASASDPPGGEEDERRGFVPGGNATGGEQTHSSWRPRHMAPDGQTDAWSLSLRQSRPLRAGEGTRATHEYLERRLRLASPSPAAPASDPPGGREMVCAKIGTDTRRNDSTRLVKRPALLALASAGKIALSLGREFRWNVGNEFHGDQDGRLRDRLLTPVRLLPPR